VKEDFPSFIFTVSLSITEGHCQVFPSLPLFRWSELSLLTVSFFLPPLSRKAIGLSCSRFAARRGGQLPPSPLLHIMIAPPFCSFPLFPPRFPGEEVMPPFFLSPSWLGSTMVFGYPQVSRKPLLFLRESDGFFLLFALSPLKVFSSVSPFSLLRSQSAR